MSTARKIQHISCRSVRRTKQDRFIETFWWEAEEWAIVAALKRIVLDGEAVILGVDGIADFNALHSRLHDHEEQFCALYPRRRRRSISGASSTPPHDGAPAPLARRQRVFSSTPLSAPRSGQTYSRPPPVGWVSRVCIGSGRIKPAERGIG